MVLYIVESAAALIVYMSTFLFWNTGRSDITELVSKAAREFDVDVLILAECSMSGAELLMSLNRNSSDYQLTFTANETIKVLTRFHSRFLRPTAESKRYSVRRLRLPGQKELLLVIAHLPSGLYFTENSRSSECIELARLVVEEEKKAGHDRTLLVGDLNVNPFETGVVAANGLNAVMTRALAERRFRTVQERLYPMFYNPMWRFFGAGERKPSGTYYYERAEHVIYFWNIFDQVLVRPSLISGLSDEHIKIVDKIGELALTHFDGRPNRSVGSDHLPIVFDLEIPLEEVDVERNAGSLA
jgi:endonuclease/exonuclease/phosphatase family metal-dependent hydrolase